MITAGPKHIMKMDAIIFWSVRLPLRNDMNFASIKNTFDPSIGWLLSELDVLCVKSQIWLNAKNTTNDAL